MSEQESNDLCGYNVLTMKTISIAELKRGLSACLETVRAGNELLVTDRGRPVAKLVPLGADALEADARVAELVRKGLARGPVAGLPPDVLDLPRPSDPQGRVLGALLEERAEGR